MNLFPKDIGDGPYERPKQPMKQAEKTAVREPNVPSSDVAQMEHGSAEFYEGIIRSALLSACNISARITNPLDDDFFVVVATLGVLFHDKVFLRKIPSKPTTPINRSCGKHESPPYSLAEKGGVQ